jgi:O-antigen/teichoic acid export membrane protein
MVDLDRASLALFGSRVTAQLLGFLGVVYFARELGAGGLGIYFTFVTVVSVTSVFAKFGLPGALVKRMNQSSTPSERGAYLTGALCLLVPPLVVTAGLMLAFGDRLSDYVGLSAVAPVVVAGVAVGVASTMLLSALRGEARLTLTAGVELFGQIARLTASIALLAVGFEAAALVFGSILAGVARSALSGYLLDTTLAVPSWETVTSLFDFSKYTVGMNVSGLAYNWADTLVLAAVASKADVGVYETAWMVSVVTLLAARAIGVSLAPTVTRWHEDGDTERIEQAFSTGITFGLLLVVPAVVGAAVVGDEVLATLYGFDRGGTVLLLLLVGQLAAAVKNITQNTLFGIDRPEHVFWTNVATLAANVALNLLLIPRYGMYGAAAATASTATVAAVSQYGYLRRYLTPRVDLELLGWQVAAALAMGLVVAVLAEPVPLGSEVWLVALVAFGAVVYAGGLLTNPDLRGRVQDRNLW